MWMSNILITVDRLSARQSGLIDISAAIASMEESAVLNVDEQHHVIEASVPAHELPKVKEIAGVCYVRCVFNYFVNGPKPTKAA
jgi:hypothetical protein